MRLPIVSRRITPAAGGMLRCLLTTGRGATSSTGFGREELGKWHSEQESKLDTYGLEVSGGYTTTGFLHRISVSYGYIHTSKVDRVITSSALDYMKHKAAATVEFRFLAQLFAHADRVRYMTATAAIPIICVMRTVP